MRIIIAPDSFKDALRSDRVASAIRAGIEASQLQANCTCIPLADGGEGTVEVLAAAGIGEVVSLSTEDALGRSCVGRVVFAASSVAYVVLSEAAGLEQLGLAERNPEQTSTKGVGRLLRLAIERGARQIVLALGGSATQDLGLGLLEGLGYTLLDRSGDPMRGAGGNLWQLQDILEPTDQAFAAAFAKTQVTVWCDVQNPVLGPSGTAHTYAGQKGADAAAIDRLESGGVQAVTVLQRFADQRAGGKGASLATLAGGGAAGGVAVALSAIARVQLVSGAEALLQLLGFRESLQKADLLITAEGALDAQTARGKLTRVLSDQAHAAGVPVLSLCGSLSLSSEELAKLGLAAAFPIGAQPRPLTEALANTESDLMRTAESIGNLLAIRT